MSIHSPETLSAEIDHIEGRAGADREAAVAARKFAAQERADLDRIIAAAHAFRFPAAVVRRIGAVVDAVSREIAACDAHLKASDGKLDAARKAAGMAAEHRQMQGRGAAGQFYTGRPVVDEDVKAELFRRALSIVTGVDVPPV